MIINTHLDTPICLKQKVLNSPKTNIWFDLKLLDIRVFSSKSATKNFYLREFFQQHLVSNKRICNIKRIFIELIHKFYQFELIESKVKLLLHHDYVDIEDLTTFNISEGFTLYEKIVSK